LFDVKRPEDDLKKIETSPNISEFYVKLYCNTCAFAGFKF